LSLSANVWAAANSPELAREFERFLKWREENPAQAQAILEIPIADLVPDPFHPGLETQKVDAFRGRLRAGDIAPPITVKQTDAGYQIIDGHHRADATRCERRQVIRAKFPKESQT
jgi:hypothetical protein